ncbi:hypothetical protein BH10CYA1_BH10CYA1_55680 [soil metagenome]
MGQVYMLGALETANMPVINFDVPTSVLWLRAMGKDAEAQNCLGTALLHGIDVKQNFAQAYYWFKSSCNLGSLNACLTWPFYI